MDDHTTLHVHRADLDRLDTFAKKRFGRTDVSYRFLVNVLIDEVGSEV